MLNFICTVCQKEIQAEYQYIGEIVECPICNQIQIVPDPVLPSGSEYHGYMIGKTLATTMLWSTYEAVGRTELPDQHVVLRIPTTFFLKNVSDFNAFVETVIKAGSLNMTEIPALLDRSLAPGKVYFVFAFVQSAYKLSYFKDERLLDYNNALLITREIADTLKRVWGKESLIHQNLIPANIRVTNKLGVRISNIGISNFLLKDQNLIRQGFNIWDYHFMSPEFITDGIADSPLCDIYALGGILFMLCTGHMPHENADPSDIVNAPIPSLNDYMTDAPEKLISLVQLMMSPNMSLRLQTWDEVIERIDKIITDTTRMRKNDDILRQFNMQGIQTGRYEPVGMAAGFKRKVIKSSTGKFAPPEKNKHVTDTVVRLASKEEMFALNREWKQGRRDATRRTSRHKKTSPTPFIFAAVILLVGILAFVTVYLSAQAKKRNLAQRTIQQAAEDTVPAPVAPKRPVTDTPADVGRIPAQTTPAIVKKEDPAPAKIQQTAEKSTLENSMKEIDDFLLKNPEMTKEASAKYDELMTQAVKSKKFDLVDILQDKINQLSNINAAERSKQIETVISVIKKQIVPLLQDEKFDEALNILENYDGELANESRRARLDLAQQIQERIEKIRSGRSGNIDAVKAFAAKFAPDLMAGKILDAKIKIDLGLKLETNDIVKDQAARWLVEVDNFEKIMKNPPQNGESVINAPENKEIMNDAYLLQALIFTETRQFVNAKGAFEKIPYDAGKVFLDLLVEKDAAAVFTNILAKYEFKYESQTPSNLMLQLTKKTIRPDKAETLKQDLALFSKEFANTGFLRDNLNILDALNTYCARITGEIKEAPPAAAAAAQDNLIKPGDSNSAKPFTDALANAKVGAVLNVSAGLYKFGGDLNIKQSDITISGEKGVVWEIKTLFISGHNVKFNNITFTEGTVKVEKTHNIIFNSCAFKGKETEIIESNSVTLNNCLIFGIYVKTCENLLLKHCTILTPRGGIEASVRVESESIEIEDSIIYGEKFAMMMMLPEDNPRKSHVYNSLWFGEKALAVKQLRNQPLKEKDIADKSSKLKKMIKTKSNVHKPPQFINPAQDNYRLVKGVPGSGEASDKKDCGVLWGDPDTP